MSGTNTITMAGNSTGYGLFSGSDVFNLSGYANTVLMNGANDAVNIGGGGGDVVDLNYAGFTGPVTDSVNLGTSSFNSVTDSHALYGADLTIAGNGGPSTITVSNHGGSTAISLGYTGNPIYEHSIGLDNVITLNGDASNFVGFTAGGYADVAIGAAGDRFFGDASTVAFYGAGNTLVGGDEAFTVSNSNGSATSVTLGNGNNTVNLSGGYNSVSVGNGQNTVNLRGPTNTASFGTGSNSVSLLAGGANLTFAAGDAGASEQLRISHGVAFVHGGAENFTITGTTGDYLDGRLGDGSNTIAMGDGRADMVIGDKLDNAADNSFTSIRGGNSLAFNGGTDQITLLDQTAGKGYDSVWLNAARLGTTLSAYGAFDKVTLALDSNATINDDSVNGGLKLTLIADKTGGFGQISINGLSTDDLAHIDLVNASAYTITADNTPAGGITLHFDHGTLDLIGLQAVPNNLFT